MKVPFVNIALEYQADKDNYDSIFADVAASGQYVMGSYLQDFENNIADYCGCEHALGVANGSDALVLLLRALKIGAGDEVIVPTHSFIATAWVVHQVGAKIVFADIDEETMNIDHRDIRRKITSRTKAIIPVHLSGRLADMSQILSLASANNLYVIEDAAQAIGANFNGKKAGTYGNGAGFSLHPLKNMGIIGDGGFITTNDKKIYDYILKDRNHGLRDRDNCDFWGINSRLDALQAALATHKLKTLDKRNRSFRTIAKFYRDNLQDFVRCPSEDDGEYPVYHNFVIRTERREDLQAFLLKNGVETKIHYPVLLHLQPPAKEKGYKKGDFSVAEKVISEVLSLPIYPELQNSQYSYVVEQIKRFCMDDMD